jgi:hypothetical protein
MSDETASAAGLVTEPAPAREKPLELETKVIEPAAVHDPAAHLNPAKVKQPAPKRKRAKRPPAAKRAATRQSAAKAGDARSEAASAAAIASQEHRRAVSDELRAAYEAATVNRVESFADLPEDGALQLRLANGSEFVEGALAVARNDLPVASQASRRTYARAVDIGPDCGPVRVTEAWLVADSGEAVKCEVGLLSGGNGHHAQIPAGHLLF